MPVGESMVKDHVLSYCGQSKRAKILVFPYGYMYSLRHVPISSQITGMYLLAETYAAKVVSYHKVFVSFISVLIWV